MDQIVGAAARLPDNERKDLAILALARSATITDLAIGRGVSRKFVYAQTQKARVALGDAFLPATGADDVLFELAVTKTWLRQSLLDVPNGYWAFLAGLASPLDARLAAVS